MVCYEDFAVFPGMLMQASKIVYQRQGHYYYIKRNDSLSSRLDASKIATLVDCTLQMEKKRSLVLLRILLIVTGLISTETTDRI